MFTTPATEILTSYAMREIHNVKTYKKRETSHCKESAKSRAWRACVLACLTCLACLRAWRACVLTCSACLRACMYMLCLRASYDACFACLPLTYSRFCLIIYFVCINQGFTIKRKLLIHVNLS